MVSRALIVSVYLTQSAFAAGDEAARSELQKFMNNPSQRVAFSQGNAQASHTNNVLGAFPA